MLLMRQRSSSPATIPTAVNLNGNSNDSNDSNDTSATIATNHTKDKTRPQSPLRPMDNSEAFGEALTSNHRPMMILPNSSNGRSHEKRRNSSNPNSTNNPNSPTLHTHSKHNTHNMHNQHGTSRRARSMKTFIFVIGIVSSLIILTWLHIWAVYISEISGISMVSDISDNSGGSSKVAGSSEASEASWAIDGLDVHKVRTHVNLRGERKESEDTSGRKRVYPRSVLADHLSPFELQRWNQLHQLHPSVEEEDESDESQPWKLWNSLPHILGSPKEKRTIDDPMLHHEGWSRNEEEEKEKDDEENEIVNPSGDEHEKPLEGGQLHGGHGGDNEEHEEHPQCVPMAEWQTTSYPNCNTVHEIDMVLSSGSGSQTFSYAKSMNIYKSQRHPPHSPTTRRSITTFPNILRKLIDSLPPKSSKISKSQRPSQTAQSTNEFLNANGIMSEEDVTFLGQGWFRSAWRVDITGDGEYDEWEEEEWEEDSVVLKTLRIERDFLPEYYELHRRDALAMERLTFSPYVMDIYGYCGQSAINELANFGIEGLSSLEKIARQFRGVDVEPVNKIKLQLSAMVAKGVSHVHSVDYPDFVSEEEEEEEYDDDWHRQHRQYRQRRMNGTTHVSNATMVHYDLNPRNIAIIEKGRPKLNDFNLATFLTYNPTTQSTCGFPARFHEPWWRSPEEMQYFHTNHSIHTHHSNYSHQTNHSDHTHHTHPAPLTEKVDIYSLGNILFEILTSHAPRGKMKKELMDHVRPLVARGELPTLPSEFVNVRDPALVAIRKAMYKCWRKEPGERPTAGEVADELERAIEGLPEGYGDREKYYESLKRGRGRGGRGGGDDDDEDDDDADEDEAGSGEGGHS